MATRSRGHFQLLGPGRQDPVTTIHLPDNLSQFRMYIGLLAHPKNPSQVGDGDNGAEDSDVEDMGEPTRNPQQPRRDLEVEVAVESSKKAKSRRPFIFDPNDPKTECFLDDPETSVKIFFSSYFRKKGLLW